MCDYLWVKEGEPTQMADQKDLVPFLGWRTKYRIWQKNLMTFKLNYSEKYTIFLREFITKIMWK